MNILPKFKIGELVAICGITFTTIILGLNLLSIKNLKISNDNTTNIYEYYGWSNQISDMKESVLQINYNLENASRGVESEHLSNIKEYDKYFKEAYDEFTSTESSDEELFFLANILSGYESYMKLVDELMNEYSSGEADIYEYLSERKYLENIILSNLEGLQEYVRGYAEEDYSENSKIYKAARIENIIIISLATTGVILISVLVFIIAKKEMAYITECLEKIAAGDLCVNMKILNSRNEIAIIKKYINNITSNFAHILKGLQDKSNDIDVKSGNLMAVSEELVTSINNIDIAIGDASTGTSEQASDMLEISSILNTFSEKIDDFSNNIEFLSNNSNDISNRANMSSKQMDELMKSFKEIEKSINIFITKIVNLNSSMNEIKSISNLINDIAEQTNLLALNAAIESARAGEAGKGFAVVAEEIRKLSEESQNSANNINSLIVNIDKESKIIVSESNDMKGVINMSASVIDETIRSFKDIIKSIEDIVPKIESLSKSSEKISREKDIIYEKIENSTSISEEISASTEEISASIGEMKEGCTIVSGTATDLTAVTNELNEEIKVFKTN